MHNAYYGTAAIKGLLSCTPFGSADFCSDLYPARADDETIWEASGCGETIPKGMDVSLDKGFYVAAQMFKRGCGVVQPVKKPNSKRYSQKALLYSRRVSRNRIHVERQVRRMKGRCGWLQRTIPMNQMHLVYPITQICFFLGNFMTPLAGKSV
jgi:hypothetical protein